jgi:predicted outer membrane protein
LAEFAQEKSQQPAVQQFAKRMVEDHGKFLKKVNGHQAAAGREEGPRDTAARDSARDAGARDTARDGRSEANPGQSGLNGPYRTLAMIDEEVAQKCLQSAQQELASKQGAEFEKCFFGMQLFLHQGMVDKLQVLQEHASPELAQTLQEGVKTSQEHARLAQQMLDQATAETASTSPANRNE